MRSSVVSVCQPVGRAGPLQAGHQGCEPCRASLFQLPSHESTVRYQLKSAADIWQLQLPSPAAEKVEGGPSDDEGGRGREGGREGFGGGGVRGGEEKARISDSFVR